MTTAMAMPPMLRMMIMMMMMMMISMGTYITLWKVVTTWKQKAINADAWLELKLTTRVELS
jgi:hypothetical protein